MNVNRQNVKPREGATIKQEEMPMSKNLPANIINFANKGWNVRVVMRDGEPWFVAKDVARNLGYTNTKKATIDHCKHAELLKGNESLPLTESPRGIAIIPESDVYRLVLRSKLPHAEAFQDWIVEDVIPQIRKEGAYSLAGADRPALVDTKALEAKMSVMEKQIDLYREQNNRLWRRIEDDVLDVAKGRAFDLRQHVMTMSEAANFITQHIPGLEIGRNGLFAFLREEGCVARHGYAPTKKGLACGFVAYRKKSRRKGKYDNGYITTGVKPRGLNYIVNRFARRFDQLALPGTRVVERDTLYLD